MGKNKLVIMNGDRAYCEHLASAHQKSSVIYGDPCKELGWRMLKSGALMW